MAGIPSNQHRAEAYAASSDIALAPVACAVGMFLLIAAFAHLDRVPGWADDYGAILVYLAFFLYMSIAGRLTWWGIDTLYARMKAGRSGR